MRGHLSQALAGVLMLAASPAVAQSIQVTGDRQPEVPEEYIVEQGDTLWGICDEFFADPHRWPTVWAINPHITNPHWIYPDDVIRLRLGEGDVGPAGATLAPVTYTVGTQSASQVSLNEGFITEKALEETGRISFSPEPKAYLATHDRVYLEFPSLDEVRIGQQFSVYRVVNDVYHPETGELIGQKIQIHGVVEVEGLEDHIARAKIITAFSEIERGMGLTKLLDHYTVVSPRQNLIDLKGTIVDALGDFVELGQFHVVLIDRGAKDGVQVGNRLFVMRRGDGFVEVTDDGQKKLPWEQVGEILVVKTEDRTATAVVTRSAIELKRGDQLVMQRHY